MFKRNENKKKKKKCFCKGNWKLDLAKLAGGPKFNIL